MEHGQRREQKHKFEIYCHTGECGTFNATSPRQALNQALKQAGRRSGFWKFAEVWPGVGWLYAVRNIRNKNAVYFAEVL